MLEGMNTQQVKKFLIWLGKSFLKSLKNINEVELGMRASSLTFTSVLSIAPLLAVSFYVFKMIGGFERAYEKLEPFLLENLSEGTGENVANYLSSFIQNVHAKSIGWVGIAGLFFTAVMTYLKIAGSFQKIWNHVPSPKFSFRITRAALLILIGPILLSLSIYLSTMLATQIKVIPHSGYAVAILLNLVLYTMIYYWIPPERIPLKTVILGAILPSILWEITKSNFTHLTKSFLDYSKFYGSLATIPLFLIWVYIAWYITLFGAVWIKTLHTKE